jgi:hypothetical protein
VSGSLRCLGKAKALSGNRSRSRVSSSPCAVCGFRSFASAWVSQAVRLRVDRERGRVASPADCWCSRRAGRLDPQHAHERVVEGDAVCRAARGLARCSPGGTG